MTNMLFKNEEILDDKYKIQLGRGISIGKSESFCQDPIVTLYRHGAFIKSVDLSDKTAKRLFVVETVELGSEIKARANALGIARQTIYNYLVIQKRYGREGLVHGYTSTRKSQLRYERKKHSKKRDKSDGRRAQNLIGNAKSMESCLPRKVYI
jgi:hypothetical protein